MLHVTGPVPTAARQHPSPSCGARYPSAESLNLTAAAACSTVVASVATMAWSPHPSAPPPRPPPTSARGGPCAPRPKLHRTNPNPAHVPTVAAYPSLTLPSPQTSAARAHTKGSHIRWCSCRILVPQHFFADCMGCSGGCMDSEETSRSQLSGRPGCRICQHCSNRCSCRRRCSNAFGCRVCTRMLPEAEAMEMEAVEAAKATEAAAEAAKATEAAEAARTVAWGSLEKVGSRL